MSNRTWIFIAIVVIILIVIGYIIASSVILCNQSIFPLSSCQQSDKSYVNKNISPDFGGSIEIVNDTRVDIPPGAIDNDGLVMISKSTDLIPVGEYPLDEIMVREINIENASIVEPITLSFNYEGLIDQNAQNPNIFYIARWNETQWEYLGGEVDPIEKTISIEIDHLSVFGVFALPSLDVIFEKLNDLISQCTPGIYNEDLTRLLIQIIDANSNEISTKNVKVYTHENLGTFQTTEGIILVDRDFFNKESNWIPTHSYHNLLEPMLAHELSHIENSTTDIEEISEIIIEGSNNTSFFDFSYEIRAYLKILWVAIMERDCYLVWSNILNFSSVIGNQFISGNTCDKHKQGEINADLDGVRWASKKNNELISTALVFTHFLHNLGEDSSCTYPSGIDRANYILSNIDIGDVGGVYGRITISDNTAINEINFSELIINVDDSINEKTDSQGRFLVTGFIPGQHTLTLSVPGFIPISKTSDIPSQKLVEVNLSLEREIEVDFPIVNIGFPKSIYVRYDPSIWDVIEMDPVYQTEEGEPVSSLQHKDFPECSIHNNWGRTLSPDYKKNVIEKVIGNLDYQLETWSDPTGKPYLTVYQHSPIDWIVRIELLIGSEPDVCIQDAEDVLAISSDLLISNEEEQSIEGQIAYLEKGIESTALKLMNADGSSVETLLASWLSDPTWSPDGQEIIVAESLSSSNRWQIISFNTKTKQQEILVPSEIPGFPDYNEWYYRYRNPRIPSDGDTLYFIMGGDTPIEAILQLEVDSGVFHQVLPTMIISSFDISPDNQLVDIFCNQQEIDCYINVRYPIDIKVSNTIYHRKDQTVCCAVWSPDGQEIAFITASELPDSQDAAGHIWIMSSDGNDLRQLTFDDNYSESDPQWSTKGNRLVFSRKARDNQFADIWIVSTDGEELFNLTNSPTLSEEQPIWQPNP
ncbi:hypothetical protein ACFLY4_10030 [Chloroflexota bacterium]